MIETDLETIETTIETENEIMIHVGLVRDTEIEIVIVKRMEEK